MVENLAEKLNTRNLSKYGKTLFQGCDKILPYFQESAKEHSSFHLFGCIFAPVNQIQQGVCQNCGLAIYVKKYFSGKKEEL